MIRLFSDIELGRVLRRTTLALLFSFICLHAMGEEEGETRPMVLITNLENPAEEISKGELGRIYLKQKRFWLNGERCVPIDQPGTSEIRKGFYDVVLGKTPYAMKRYWMQETMTGNAKPPVTLDNSTTVKRYVRKIKGGLGYIYADEIDDTVKILRVTDVPDFHTPNEEDSEEGAATNQDSAR